MTKSRGTGRRISRYADPEKYQHLLDQFEEQTPDNPWNHDAAETLAKPPERRGWQTTYVKARENWRIENDQT